MFSLYQIIPAFFLSYSVGYLLSEQPVQKSLDYNEWRNFLTVLEKAKVACHNSGQDVNDHFVGVNDIVLLGSGSEREVEDYKLTRYACYLVAQNGRGHKETRAKGKSKGHK